MTVGEFLLRRLQEAGIGHLFGVPGDFNLELRSSWRTLDRCGGSAPVMS
jgi:TPP-dependent 2-oxoacid decarboxylase